MSADLPAPFDRQAHIDRLGEAMLGVLRRQVETDGTDAAILSADGAVVGALKFMAGFENGLQEVVRICEDYRDQALRLIAARKAADAPTVLN